MENILIFMGKRKSKREIRSTENLTLQIRELHKQQGVAFQNQDGKKFREIQSELAGKLKELLIIEFDLEKQIKEGFSKEDEELLVSAVFGKTKKEIMEALKKQASKS